MADWTQPPLAETPGDLGPALMDARLVAVENDRAGRTVRLIFELPEGSGLDSTTFIVQDATHLLTFVYLPPAVPLAEGLSPEEAMATVGDWARTGLVVSTDPLGLGTLLVVQRASLHVGEGFVTLAVEGYGEDPDALVWWEVRASGASVDLENAR